MVFTFALATDVRDMRLAVFDAADTPQTRAVVQAIRATGYFDVRRTPSLAALRADLAAGAVSGAVLIPPAAEARRAERGAPPQLQLLLDGSQAVLAANANALLTATAAQAGGDETGRVRLVERALYNPGLDSAHYMIPGLLGYVFTFLTILVAAVSIVRERVGGTFEQLMMTPVQSHEIVAAKLAVLGVALLIDEAIVMVVGGLGFGVWPRGSALLLIAVTALYLLMTLAIGLVISAGLAHAGRGGAEVARRLDAAHQRQRPGLSGDVDAVRLPDVREGAARLPLSAHVAGDLSDGRGSP